MEACSALSQSEFGMIRKRSLEPSRKVVRSCSPLLRQIVESKESNPVVFRDAVTVPLARPHVTGASRDWSSGIGFLPSRLPELPYHIFISSNVNHQGQTGWLREQGIQSAGGYEFTSGAQPKS
ncbi:hypothetical protein PAAG_08857 [Paracoccidioides lutzii Pb01]|uniref:Uncharacterized protein n=1 Tax=Paracoccidioides lutzii (strain ATCC MYA-826 / Pb01) TaxID=502779 RepID=C1HDL6_PARBA|nr:hypothetical protein PAAG_08857 [Paracoccidioides lutzii Pb01]EEH39587.2 hypothetical protein PAAG_08857 [Paracoccidioides lutzii Pb01]